jgi:hypothetical protein
MAQRNPDSYTGPRQLAQSGRNLFLDCSEKSPHAQRFSSLHKLEQRLLAFQSHYERSASPFNWTFTRRDLNAFWPKLTSNGWLRRLDKIRHRNSEYGYLAKFPIIYSDLRLAYKVATHPDD